MVYNYSTSTDSYTFTATCVSGDACGTPSPASASLAASDSIAVQVAYTTGSLGQADLVKLTATSTAGVGFANFGSYNVSVTPAMTVSTAFTNQDNQVTSLCAASCFAASYTATTIPFMSMNAPHSVSLVYNGDRIAVRPFVYADVSVQSGSGLLGYTLQAQVDWTGSGTWTNVNFLNVGSEQVLRFAADSSPVRLGGQFDASSYPSKAYPLRIIVTGNFPNGYSESITDSSHFLLVENERSSPIARGWQVSGVPRLYDNTNKAVLIAEGNGSATVYAYSLTDGSGAKHYTSPVGDYSSVTYNLASSAQYQRAFGDSTKQIFDNMGRLLYIVDRFGHRRDLVYDSQGRLTRIGDEYRTRPDSLPLKTYVALAYNTYGLASIREPGPTGTPSAGRATIIAVGADSSLTQIQDPDGVSTKFLYDSRRRLSGIVNRRGDTTSFAYLADSSWKLASVTMPQVSIDSSGSTLSRAPKVNLAPWDTTGVPYAATSTTPKTPALVAAVKGSVTDPAGHRSSFTVDRWGQPLVVSDPSGTTTIVRSGKSQVEVNHPNGVVDRFTYNASGVLTKSWLGTEPHGTVIHYGPYLLPDTVIKPDLETSVYYRGLNGRVDSARVNGALSKFYYDALFRDTLSLDPVGHRIRLHYDARTGNEDSMVTMPQTGSGRVASTAWRFDAFGRDSIVSGANKPTVTTLYDSMNRPVSVLDGVHPNPTTFKYDALFRTRAQDPKGQVFRRDVNALGAPTRVYDAADTLNRYVSTRYNIDGLVVGRTNRRGTPIALAYDSLHRLVSQSDTTSPVNSFQYALNSRVIASSNSISTDSSFFSADYPPGPPYRMDSTVTWLGGKRFRRYYHQDAQGRVDSVNISMGTTGTVDFAVRKYYFGSTTGNLDSIGIDTVRTHFRYDADQERDSTRYANITSRVDSLTSQHTVFKTRYTATNLDSAFNRAYSYDSASKLIEEVRHAGALREVRDIKYDLVDELSRVQKAIRTTDKTCTKDLGCQIDTTIVPFSVLKYSYDAAGNISTEIDSIASVTNTFSLGAANHLVSMSTGSVVDSVDADGNRYYESSVGGTRKFTWDASGLLRKVVAGSRTLTYDYNANGELVRRSVNGAVDRYFLWDAGQMLVELNSTASARIAEYAYLPGVDHPLAVITGGTGAKVYHFLSQDQMGNVLGAFSSATSPDLNLRFDAWGRLDSRAGSMPDSLERLRWKGLMWEGDSTRLYYARARWYDPATHRFMTEDPLGIDVGLNAFLFASSQPITGSDPSGRCPYYTYDDDGDHNDFGDYTDACWGCEYAVAADDDLKCGDVRAATMAEITVEGNPDNYRDPDVGPIDILSELNGGPADAGLPSVNLWDFVPGAETGSSSFCTVLNCREGPVSRSHVDYKAAAEEAIISMLPGLTFTVVVGWAYYSDPCMRGRLLDRTTGLEGVANLTYGVLSADLGGATSGFLFTKVAVDAAECSIEEYR